MSDLISRKEAIKQIKKLAEQYANNQTTDSSQYFVGKEDGCCSAIYVLEELKSAKPKTGRWIPVSERMPEETGWYFVTFKIHGGGYATCELSYRKPENYWTSTDISRKVFSNDEVIAWMPLPKPYEDGGSRNGI